MRRVLRYEVRVDDTVQAIGQGRVLMAHPWRQTTKVPAGRVEVWVEVEVAESWPASEEPIRKVVVFGTGHPIPYGAVWLASCLDGSLVWHVYEVADR